MSTDDECIEECRALRERLPTSAYEGTVARAVSLYRNAIHRGLMEPDDDLDFALPVDEQWDRAGAATQSRWVLFANETGAIVTQDQLANTSTAPGAPPRSEPDDDDDEGDD